MADPVDQLVSEIISATGASAPGVLEADAPVPAEDAGELYYVGLIGGKDVGKTSLVNALAGQTIAEPTGHGEGTRFVTAYAHADAAEQVRRQVGDIAVVTHHVAELRRQVLLDLPDIDSRYADHVQLTRQMLRHMLYPIWVQSVEKYADQRPQQLLRQVAEGNDPANFLFVLNKTDQLIDREGLPAALELAEDYAQRLGRLLRLPTPPEVMIVSARRPEEYDLPRLRRALGVQRSAKQVAQSRQLASRRRLGSIAEWMAEQNLAARAEAARRLVDDAGDVVAERLGVPVLEGALPRLDSDAAHRLSLAEPAVRARMRAWPIVNLIDAAVSPVFLLVRKNLAPGAAGHDTASAAVDAYFAEAGRPLAKGVQATFAQLNNAYPDFGRLYDHRRLWEQPEAEAAAADLRRRVAAAVEAQRVMVRERLRPRAWLAPLRWLLTVGAALWFILLQPVVWTAMNLATFSWAALVREFVRIISAEMLLTNVGFVLVYLLVLWGVLRYSAHGRVAAARRRMASADADHPEASPAAQTVEWMQSLLSPLERRHAELADLATRADHLRDELTTRPAAAA